MSFEKVEYYLDNKCYVVRAVNKDNDGQESNGGGKTSFVDIAAVALLGYSLTGRNVKDCVNWNNDAKSFTVQLFMQNEEHGLDCYITRKVYASASKGQELSLLVNDVVPPTIPTKKGVENGVDIKEGNAYILKEILDIKIDDLLNYYLISKTNYKPFLEINTDRKLEVISRFSKAQVVDTVISKLEENVKEIEQDINKVEHNISATNGYIEALNQALLEPAMEQFEIEKAKEIESINAELSSLMDQYDNSAADLELLGASLEQLEAKPIEDFDQQIKSLTAENSKLGDKLNEHISYVYMKEQQLGKFNALIQNAIKCPQCSHEFNLKGEAIPAKVEVEWLSEQVKDLQNQTIQKRAEKKEADEKLKPLLEKKQQQDVHLNEIAILKRKIKNIADERNEIVRKINEADDKSQIVASRTFEDQSASIRLQLAQKEQDIQSFGVQHAELKEEITNVKKWIEHFYDFKFYLGNKPLEQICIIVNQYLQMNGSDLNLFIEGFKKLRSGEIRQALNPIVYRNWTNPQALAQFSEGERARLNLTVDLAFQQLINSTSKYGGLDFYQNDELLNPLDSAGVSNAAKAFNQLNKTILLVTHSGSDMVYDNTILIQKENKVSKLM